MTSSVPDETAYSDTPWLVVAPDGSVAAAYPEWDAAAVTASRMPPGYVVQRWLDEPGPES